MMLGRGEGGGGSIALWGATRLFGKDSILFHCAYDTLLGWGEMVGWGSCPVRSETEMKCKNNISFFFQTVLAKSTNEVGGGFKFCSKNVRGKCWVIF